MSNDGRRDLLVKVRAELPPQGFLDYREYLATAYKWLKERLGRYSYLQYAEDLGFSHTNVVHLVIRGRRVLSPQAAKRVGAAFGLTDLEQAYLLSLCEYQNAKEPAIKDVFHRRLLELRGGETAATTSLHAQRPGDDLQTTVAIPRTLAPELEREVAEFRRRLAALVERSHETPDEVYVLSVQRVPVAAPLATGEGG